MTVTEQQKDSLRAQMEERADIMERYYALRRLYSESKQIPTWLPLYVLLRELGEPSLAEYLEDEITPKDAIAGIVERCEKFAKLL